MPERGETSTYGVDEDGLLARLLELGFLALQDCLSEGHGVRVRLHSSSKPERPISSSDDTYDVESNVGLSSEAFHDLEVGIAANDSLVDAEFSLESLRLLGVADEDGDIKLAALGVLENLGKDSAANEA